VERQLKRGETKTSFGVCQKSEGVMREGDLPEIRGVAAGQPQIRRMAPSKSSRLSGPGGTFRGRPNSPAVASARNVFPLPGSTRAKNRKEEKSRSLI
jgi:hypothetical protein